MFLEGKQRSSSSGSGSGGCDQTKKKTSRSTMSCFFSSFVVLRAPSEKGCLDSFVFAKRLPRVPAAGIQRREGQSSAKKDVPGGKQRRSSLSLIFFCCRSSFVKSRHFFFSFFSSTSSSFSRRDCVDVVFSLISAKRERKTQALAMFSPLLRLRKRSDAALASLKVCFLFGSECEREKRGGMLNSSSSSFFGFSFAAPIEFFSSLSFPPLSLSPCCSLVSFSVWQLSRHLMHDVAVSRLQEREIIRTKKKKNEKTTGRDRRARFVVKQRRRRRKPRQQQQRRQAPLCHSCHGSLGVAISQLGDGG